MKVLTFFTVRGGSGKTVLSAAFASYMSYILGKRAVVLDFDEPEYNLYNMRLRELSLMKEGDAECDRDGLYIMEKVENTDSDSLDRFAENIRRIKEQCAWQHRKTTAVHITISLRTSTCLRPNTTRLSRTSASSDSL